ncbi:hypothetical protein NL676_030103 [Syzygium grande]|nr:hypothetical protein NL676_030103 [Syzygium grande]
MLYEHTLPTYSSQAAGFVAITDRKKTEEDLSDHNISWKEPPSDRHRSNVDGTVDEECGRAGSGGGVCDCCALEERI